MPEQEIKSLECKKMEQKETTTDKGESVTFTYTFTDEDKDNVVTLKTTREQDYVVGQDVSVMISTPQTAVTDFTEEEAEENVETREHHPDCPAIDGMGCRCSELEVPEEETEPEPTIEHPHVFENPGCKYYHRPKSSSEDTPGMCSNSKRAAPFCEGPYCKDITPHGGEEPEEELETIPDEQYEVEIPEEPKMTEGSVTMELLINIDKNMTDDELITIVNRKFESFGKDEFILIMNWLAEENYITVDINDRDKNTMLTPKGKEIITPTKVGKEEKGSPEPPSKEKEEPLDIEKAKEIIQSIRNKENPTPDELKLATGLEVAIAIEESPTKSVGIGPKYTKKTAAELLEETPAPNAIFVNDTTVRGVPKQRWECPNCKDRWNRAPDKEGTVTKCKECKKELMLTKPTKSTHLTVINETAKDPEEITEPPIEIPDHIEISTPENPPLQDTLDKLTNGDDTNIKEDPEQSLETQIETENQLKDHGRAAAQKTMGETLKEEIEKDPEPDWGMTGNVLLKKTDFPTMNLGGLKTDITVEKNMKDKFLYAHALSFQVPVNDMQKQKFCEELKARTGYDWTHVLDSTFNCDKEQLNKGTVSA